MSIETHYLVRHGDYRFSNDGGNSDAHEALDNLVGQGVEPGTLVLSSNTERTMLTAGIIAKGLESEIVSSTRIKRGGESPRSIKNLDNFIALALDENGVSASQLGSSLVVVTHSPLVEYVKAKGIDAWKYYSSYGEVLPYSAGEWRSYPPHGQLDEVFCIEDSGFVTMFEQNLREDILSQG